MEKELLEKLNEIRKELEISMEDFIKIMALAKRRRDRSKIYISDEMLYEIVIEALSSYDYDHNEEKDTTLDAIRLLINGERQERHLSDNMLFDFIEDYLDELEKKEENKKNPKEIVDRAMKSLSL